MPTTTNTEPSDQVLQDIVMDTLVPLLSGAKLNVPATPIAMKGKSVVRVAHGKLIVKPSANQHIQFALTRGQSFSKSEVALAGVFVELLNDILPNFGKRYFADLLLTSVRRIIARALDYPNEVLLLDVLDAFEALSAQTYEGNRISAAIGLDFQTLDQGIEIRSIWKEDFSKVLTSGIDTMLTITPAGHIFDFKAFDEEAKLPYSPYHSRLIAAWTTAQRVGIVLNRNGEILIFKDKALVFSRRRGRWHHFVHDPVILQMGRVGNQELRRCVYETCLDVSFARTGGCIGVVKSNKLTKVGELINADDRVGSGQSAKSQVITRLLQYQTSRRKFQDLPRRFRQAMAAIDGATVLSHKGDILAVGAIVKVGSGSESGARRAAAKALARLGIGIKISADGGIVGFAQDGDDQRPRIVFEFS